MFIASSNDVISRLRDRPDIVVKTATKRGVVYSINASMTPIKASIAERMIAKGILVSREESGQSFELSAAWK